MARSWFADRSIDVVQVVYSLMNRESTDLIRDLGQAGAGVFARESLGNGFLSGAITRETVFPQNNLNKRHDQDEMETRIKYVNSLRFLIRDDILTMPQAAFRWVLDNPDVSLVLSGALNMVELEDVLNVPNLSSFSDQEMLQTRTLHNQDFAAA